MSAAGGDAERGSGLVEFTWLAILLMVPLLYVVLAVFDVQRAAYGATAAARAAGRAFVLAPSAATAERRARQAAELALRDQGLSLGDVGGLAMHCTGGTGCLTPGSSVTVEITARVVLPLAPAALGSARPAVRIHSSHTTPYGLYREARP